MAAEGYKIDPTRVVPLMRYRDLPEAISWLEKAFGFETHYTASDDNGELIYAQMTYGHGMVMLGPVRESDFDDLLSQPDEIGGRETQSCYLVVKDIEEHFKRAKSQGAEIALDIQSDETGGRAYSCRDCEGHLWNFGTFNPWHSTSLPISKLTLNGHLERRSSSFGKSIAAVFAGLAIAGVSIGLYSRHGGTGDTIGSLTLAEGPREAKRPDGGDAGAGVQPAAVPSNVSAALKAELSREREARLATERRLASVNDELKGEREKRLALTREKTLLQEAIEKARGGEQAALAAVERIRKQQASEAKSANSSVTRLKELIVAERKAKLDAEARLAEVERQLADERRLRREAEKRARMAGIKPDKSAVTTERPAVAKSQPKPAPPVAPAAKPLDDESLDVMEDLNADRLAVSGEDRKAKSDAEALEKDGNVKAAAIEKDAPSAQSKEAKKGSASTKPSRQVRTRKPVQRKPKPAPKPQGNVPTFGGGGWPHNTW